MAKSLAFAQFKANQGLSHKDVCDMFSISLAESKNWANGSAPKEIDQAALILNKLSERIKLKDMADIDRQHFEHQSELITKENDKLKKQIIELKRLCKDKVDRLTIENTRLKKLTIAKDEDASIAKEQMSR